MKRYIPKPVIYAICAVVCLAATTYVVHLYSEAEKRRENKLEQKVEISIPDRINGS